MAKQLNLLTTGQVISTALHTEMKQSYLEYAMSVIVGRALPDVRDGLKPVHRRILYAMHELGLTPDRPYRKCARVVGDVLGKYHPHGDQAVYDALVRMVQDFSTRYPLLAGHGNFGSVDNDPPAAMRYTETRLSPVSHEAMLTEIEAATIDFIPNFDNSQQEPVVLPAQLPILLLNGCAGIAVGMATNIPPHNLGEIIDGLIALIDRPDLTDQKLFELIPGPDFPTGGEIVETEGIRSAYTTGRGSIVVRGTIQIEEVQGGRGRHKRTAIVITELPFQVNKAGWIEKVADLVNHGRIEGIADIRDESDREGMRVVIELKREVDPQIVLQHLYHQTALQSTFGAILLALVDGQPRQLTLRELLQQFLDFREQTLIRRYTHELTKAENRLHILSGLLSALANLDEAIRILRNAADGTTAKTRLQSRFDLSDRQADAILAMPLRRLTGLERQNLQTEFEQLTVQVKELQRLLSDRRELLKALKKDLRSLKRKYADPRRTRILETPVNQPRTKSESNQTSAKAAKSTAEKAAKVEEQSNKRTPKQTKQQASASIPTLPLSLELPPEETVVEFTHRGYVRRLAPNNLERQRTKKKNPKTQAHKVIALPGNEDFSVQSQLTLTNESVLVLTRAGKAFSLNVGDIPPPSNRDGKGTPLVTLLPASAQGDPDAIAAQFVLSDYPETSAVILLTHKGRIKRLALSELANLTGRGLTVLKVKDGDALIDAHITKMGQEVLLATSGGRVLRFKINNEQLPTMGRAAMGVSALRLGRRERLVGSATLSSEDTLLLVSEQGYAKRLPVHVLRLANREEIGTQALYFADKTDTLAGMVPALAMSHVMLATSADRLLCLPVDSVPFWGKDGTGDRIVQLKPNEKILNVVMTAAELDN